MANFKLRKNAALSVLLLVSLGHLLNDMFQAVIYGTELLPANVGMISGAFFGLSFGLGGIGSALFGWLI